MDHCSVQAWLSYLTLHYHHQWPYTCNHVTYASTLSS